MDLNDKNNPFGYSLITYLWVIGLACAGGVVKYLNGTNGFTVRMLVRDIVTAGFMGLITFWLCQWTQINGPLSAILIATSGLMGNRAVKELEFIYRTRFGMRYEEEISPSEMKHEPTKNNQHLEDEL
jgi:hypothetical protein